MYIVQFPFPIKLLFNQNGCQTLWFSTEITIRPIPIIGVDTKLHQINTFHASINIQKFYSIVLHFHNYGTILYTTHYIQRVYTQRTHMPLQSFRLYFISCPIVRKKLYAFHLLVVCWTFPLIHFYLCVFFFSFCHLKHAHTMSFILRFFVILVEAHFNLALILSCIFSNGLIWTILF